MWDNKSFTVMAYANGFTLWNYSYPQESLQKMLEPGYFNKTHPFVRVGDVVYLIGKANDKVRTLQVYVSKVEPNLVEVKLVNANLLDTKSDLDESPAKPLCDCSSCEDIFMKATLSQLLELRKHLNARIKEKRNV